MGSAKVQGNWDRNRCAACSFSVLCGSKSFDEAASKIANDKPSEYDARRAAAVGCSAASGKDERKCGATNRYGQGNRGVGANDQRAPPLRKRVVPSTNDKSVGVDAQRAPHGPTWFDGGERGRKHFIKHTAPVGRQKRSAGLSRRGGHVHSFTAWQLAAHVSVRREQALKIALDHVGRDETIAADAQAGRDARTFADN